ncbi:MAG: hypothetical protein IPK84_01140 [Candidatus Moraniibacteriota bacterium]|nr:MAG: hypothetical protein IPK84_01140 [Candidatus Moranbacteria bacterium]
MLQKEQRQNVSEVVLSGIESGQEGELRSEWGRYRLLVWLPIVFSASLFDFSDSFIQTIKSFAFLLYLFFSTSLLTLSFTRAFKESTAVILRRFGLSFLVGLIVMTPLFLL